MSPSSPRQRELLELIDRERRAGCHDGAVFGGFGAYMLAQAERQDLTDLAVLSCSYSAAPAEQRPELLRQMEAILLRHDIAPLPEPEAPPAPAAAPLLSTPLTTLAGVGAKRASSFARLGIHTLGQLLLLLPRDYQDRRTVTPISQAAIGQVCTIRGTVMACETVPTRSRVQILKCYINDQSGVMPALWFNQNFLQKKLRPGVMVSVFGRVEKRYDTLELTVQDYELADQAEGGTGILPIYPATEGLSQKMLRSAMAAAWQRVQGHIPELLPERLREKRLLMEAEQALRALHFPENFGEIELARRTLAYTELLTLQLAIAAAARPARAVKRPPDREGADNEAIYRDFAAALPFAFTAAQRRVTEEIYADLDREQSMTRLVQGDVGSGKTAVAAAAIYKCCRRGQQAALMAPTEILAQQHFHSLLPLTTALGLTLGLLTGSSKTVERRAVLSQLETGVLDCVVGTHALIQEGVDFARLGLAITDEQHRFGVEQRAKLRGQENADLLVMTATPIPRTLAMTVYADLRLSLIDELPPGRRPIRTYAVDYSYEERIWAFVAKEVAAGRQAFIVCPLVEESEKMDLDSATQLYEGLRREVFPELRLALIHGKMKPAEKEAVMAAFHAGETDILVATTVVEVGVNVPNATVMVIRDAERFGLAQLHQLRGRIGRGGEQSWCVLLHNAKSPVAKERMRIISTVSDGFALAEADLQQRGPGEFFGQRQHGLPELKIADLFQDADLLELAHQDAAALRNNALPLPAPLAAERDRLLRIMVSG